MSKKEDNAKPMTHVTNTCVLPRHVGGTGRKRALKIRAEEILVNENSITAIPLTAILRRLLHEHE
jgi:hypothetical protein